MLASVEKAYAEIKKAKDKLTKIQKRCPHPGHQMRQHFDASTGNWEQATDAYWADNHCLRCDKYWRDFSQRSIAKATRVENKEEL